MSWLLILIYFHDSKVESVREIARWSDDEARSRCQSALEITRQNEVGLFACVPTVEDTK